ncbi:MAG: dTMP kinase [Candidatus Cybelea sp.]
MFVTIEGIEGSGKSTLLEALAKRLRKEGRDVVATREPGGTPAGDAIRAIFLDRNLTVAPLTEAFLVNAARAQHVADVIRPALAAGRTVLCDRFTDSTLAYQGYGRGLDLTMLGALCDAAAENLNPNLTLLVDLPVPLARSRLQARSGNLDRIESQDDAFHQRVRMGFLALAQLPHYRILDGTLNEADLLERAWTCISTS